MTEFAGMGLPFRTPPPKAGASADTGQRWRDLAGMAADLAFQTDARGRFVAVAPDPALGWPAARLLGQPAHSLLCEPDGADPFRPAAPLYRCQAWARRADGSSVRLSVCCAPLLDAAGEVVGAHGVAHDVTAQDRQDAALATALRRLDVLEQVVGSVHAEALAPRMMQAALGALAEAVRAHGAAVLDPLIEAKNPVLHQVGGDPAPLLGTALARLRDAPALPGHFAAATGHGILLCPMRTRFGGEAGLLLWRQPGGRAWQAEDLGLATSAASVVRMVLEHDQIQQEMARQSRTDWLTGLPNRRAFIEEAARRIDRLDQAALPGVLMLVDLDHLRSLNDRLGHEAGDAALRVATALMRRTIRPGDLMARLGGDEFALWLDGADELTAAERAESLRVESPRAFAELTEGVPIGLGVSIGIAMRWPASGAEIDALLRRADRALTEVKRAGRGQWRVWHGEED